MSKMIVAIDGPTGAGKTSVAKHVAQKRGLVYVDTGAMYRAVGLFVLRRGIDSRDAPKIIACLPEIDIKICSAGSGQRILLNDEDVTDLIRGETESRYASDVSAVPEVRRFLLSTQQELAEQGSVIMEGRDIGTVVLPNADVKIFLTATSEVRAKRRHSELAQIGDKTPLSAVHAALLQRDFNDSNRTAAPLRPTPCGVILDTTHLSFERVCAQIEELIDEKLKGMIIKDV